MIKKTSRHILLLAFVALSAAAACSKQAAETPGPENDGGIYFIAEERDAAAAKALLNDASLKTTGNRIHVMDVVSGFTGSASWAEGDLSTTGIYINDDISYNGAVVWSYSSGRIYPWTTDGGHQFYGWLSYDSTLDRTADTHFGETLSGNFSVANRTLSIPALEMTAATAQFDFMYANTGFYAMPMTSNSAVNLSMDHLFSAISLELRNESGDEILVESVTVGGLKNKKSAVVNFNAPPTLTTSVATNAFLDNTAFGSLGTTVRTLGENDSYDLLAQSKNTLAEYRLIWPQTAADMAPTDDEDYSTYPIVVRYQYVDDEDHINHTAHLRFPTDVSLDAGVRYAFTILFTQKHIQLNFRVNPWNYSYNSWSFSEQSISEVTELDFKDNEGYDKPSKTCTIVGGTPVKGTFRIVNPSGAIWSIEPVGDVGYFSITPSQGTIDSSSPDYEFHVIPNLDPSLDRSTDKRLKFSFHVQFTDGTVHDANSEINRDDWTVILPKI